MEEEEVKKEEEGMLRNKNIQNIINLAEVSSLVGVHNLLFSSLDFPVKGFPPVVLLQKSFSSIIQNVFILYLI